MYIFEFHLHHYKSTEITFSRFSYIVDIIIDFACSLFYLNHYDEYIFVYIFE